jgi:hypothetical protein
MEYNFIKTDRETDKDLFFGPLKEDDQFIDILNNWSMADIMFLAGIFKSKTEARKNGWNKSIEKGFSDFYAGKLRTRITILNIY